MRVTPSAASIGLWVVLLACATPPPPEDSNSVGLGVLLKVRAPLAIVPIKVEHVLFVRLDENERDPVRGLDVYYSNYAADGYYYLLNPPPGRYVAVAAVKTTTGVPTGNPNPEPWKSPPEGWPDAGQSSPEMKMHPALDIAIYLREDFVRQTEVATRLGSLSFMGEFRVGTSPLRGPDPVQGHYLRLLQPGQSDNILVQTLYHNRGIYSGRIEATERGEAARDRFSEKASEHLTSAGWGAILEGVSAGPAP